MSDPKDPTVEQLAGQILPTIKRDPEFQAMLDRGVSMDEAVRIWRLIREQRCLEFWGVPLSFFESTSRPLASLIYFDQVYGSAKDKP